VLGEQEGDAIAAERPATGVGEQGLGGLRTPFTKPTTQGGSGFLPQGRATLLASLAQAANVGAAAECNVLASKGCQLRHAQAGLNGDEEKSPVAASGPELLVRSGEQSVDLDPSEELDRAVIVALVGYGEHALDQGTPSGLHQGGISEEGVNRREADVAAARAIAALFLQGVEKAAHERRIQVFKR
jgi:hypothetical protein